MSLGAWSKLVAAGVLALQAGPPAEAVPAGTILHVRLTTAASSQTSRAGDPVEAVLIAPIRLGTRVVPAGATLAGQVAEAVRHSVDREAKLRLQFTQVARGGETAPVVTRLVDVQNARERVDTEGTILGPRMEADSGWGRAELLGLAAVAPELFAADLAGTRLREGVRVDIAYKPGVELDLAVTASFTPGTALLQAAPALPALPASLIDVVVNAPVRTAAGHPPRPADLINLVFLGSSDAIAGAFLRAGWNTADALSARADVTAFLAIAGREGYRDGPVSLETLDGRDPDLVFQKGNNTFAKRHHVRIWRRGTWEGQPLWVAAGTHDIGVKFVVQDRTFTHRVERDVDIEREKVANDLAFAGVPPAAYVERPSAPRSIQNATADEMVTDGRVAVMRVTPRNWTNPVAWWPRRLHGPSALRIL